MFGKFVFISFIFKEDYPMSKLTIRVQHLYNDHKIRMINSKHLYKHKLFWETKKKVAFGQGKPEISSIIQINILLCQVHWIS